MKEPVVIGDATLYLADCRDVLTMIAADVASASNKPTHSALYSTPSRSANPNS
ncbi:MAG: hypothetical protein H7255_08985 [Ramlibacter sp.]|nr:hypothetical protein [Ramlibacter sp.]